MGIMQTLAKNEFVASTYHFWKNYLQVVRRDAFHREKRTLLRKVLPYTQLSYDRLTNIWDVCTICEKEQVNGDFVECGVWRGGSTAIMAYIGKNRTTWLFDSFEGMPEATPEDTGVLADELSCSTRSGRLISVGTNVARLEDVKELLLKKFNFSPQHLVFVKGWFQDTLPLYKKRITAIAVLRIDGDFYASTKCCLQYLYSRVVRGGYVIIDDYYEFPGCKQAVDEFINIHSLDVLLVPIDQAGVFFKKN